MTLTEFLLARIAEDEDVARMPPPGPWAFNGPARETDVFSEPTGVTVAHVWQRDAHHIARHDPARVLAECDAKRRILAWSERQIGGSHTYKAGVQHGLHAALVFLALPYADHPDYDEKWRPS